MTTLDGEIIYPDSPFFAMKQVDILPFSGSLADAVIGYGDIDFIGSCYIDNGQLVPIEDDDMHGVVYNMYEYTVDTYNEEQSLINPSFDPVLGFKSVRFLVKDVGKSIINDNISYTRSQYTPLGQWIMKIDLSEKDINNNVLFLDVPWGMYVGRQSFPGPLTIDSTNTSVDIDESPNVLDYDINYDFEPSTNQSRVKASLSDPSSSNPSSSNPSSSDSSSSNPYYPQEFQNIDGKAVWKQVGFSGYDIDLDIYCLRDFVVSPTAFPYQFEIDDYNTQNNTHYIGVSNLTVNGISPKLEPVIKTIVTNGITNIEPSSGYDGLSDVKLIVEVPQPVIQLVKDDVVIVANGVYPIFPTVGFTAMSQVLVTVLVPPLPQPTIESVKDYGIVTENGVVTIDPSLGYDAMNQATVDVQVPQPNIQEVENHGTVTQNGELEIVPYHAYDAMKKAIINVQVPQPNIQEVENHGTVTQNGELEIVPYHAYDAMKKAIINVQVPQPTIESLKERLITANGVWDLDPSSGYDAMKKATVNVQVPQPAIESVKNYGTVIDNGVVIIDPDIGYDAMNQAIVDVQLPIRDDRAVSYNISSTYYPGDRTYFRFANNYNVPSGYVGQKRVRVEVGLKYKSITANGIYLITSDRTDNTTLGYYRVDVNVPTEVNLEEEWRVNIDSNGTRIITPSDGYDAIKKVIISTAVSREVSVERGRRVSFTTNGLKLIEPSDGYDAMEDVAIDIDVPTEANIEPTKSVSYTNNGLFTIDPSNGYDSLEGVRVSVQVPQPIIQDSRDIIITQNYITIPYSVGPSSGFDALRNANIFVDVPQPSIQNSRDITITQNYTTVPYSVGPSSGYDALRSANIFVNVPQPNLEESRIYPITQNGVITVYPTAGYDAMEKVELSVNVSNRIQIQPALFYLSYGSPDLNSDNNQCRHLWSTKWFQVNQDGFSIMLAKNSYCIVIYDDDYYNRYKIDIYASNNYTYQRTINVNNKSLVFYDDIDGNNSYLNSSFLTNWSYLHLCRSTDSSDRGFLVLSTPNVNNLSVNHSQMFLSKDQYYIYWDGYPDPINP